MEPTINRESADDLPEPSPVIVCEFFGVFFGGVRRIIVDRARGVVIFEHCHTPRAFLAWTEQERTCPTSEILEAIEVWSKGYGSLTVITARGKAVVSSTATHYRELRDALQAMILHNPHAPVTEDPRLGFMVGLGAMAGFLIGASLAPQWARDGVLAVYACAGAVLGAGMLVGVAVVCQRLWGLHLVVPFAGAFFGALITPVLGFGLDPTSLIWLSAVGAAVGFAACARIQQVREPSRPRRKPEGVDQD